MADTKLSALSVFSIDAEDLLYAVDDPSSTPTSGKILASSLMFNRYKLVVTVATNDLTVDVTHPDGNNPSSARPLYFKIGDTIRSATGTLSVTLVDGTNWMGLGSAVLAAVEQDLFAYIGYNATDGVVIGVSRVPYANQYSDFSTTSTDADYAKISTITNAAAADPYVLVGRCAATLSAGAGYTWTVPTFTPKNLIHRPIYATRWVDYNLVPTNGSTGNGTVVAKYRRDMYGIDFVLNLTFGSTTSVSGDYSFVLPASPSPDFQALVDFTESGVQGLVGYGVSGAGSLFTRAVNVAGTYPTNSTALSSTVPFTWGTGDVIRVSGRYKTV